MSFVNFKYIVLTLNLNALLIGVRLIQGELKKLWKVLTTHFTQINKHSALMCLLNEQKKTLNGRNGS